MLVTIEGIDKAGKSTVIEELQNEFPEAILTTEPYEDAWTGTAVREVLQGEREADEFGTFAMFLADHLHHIETLVGPALDEGSLVICDRYIDSRYAYQQEALKDVVPGNESPLEWIQEVQEGEYSGTIKPDLTILLDISVEESLRRKGDDPAERFEKKQFLQSVRRNYLDLAEAESDRYVVIDAEQPKEAVKAEVIDSVKEALTN